MQRFTDILFFLLLAVLTAFAQTDRPRDDRSRRADAARAEVLALEETGRIRSLNGGTNWDDIMADGAFMISPDGMTFAYKRGQVLPSFPLKKFTITELVARIYGDSVVVTGLAELEAEGPEKKIVSFQMRYVNVWARSGGSWKIVVSSRTSVKGSAKPASE